MLQMFGMRFLLPLLAGVLSSMLVCCTAMPDYKNEDTSVASVKIDYEEVERPAEPAKSGVKTQTAPDASRDDVLPTIQINSPHLGDSGKINTSKKRISIRGLANDASGIVSVFINGNEAAVLADGRFNGDIFLAIGENKIRVEAMDPYQNRKTLEFSIFRAENRHPALESFFLEGKRYALVIGNNRFVHISNLKTAAKDARDVAGVLRDQFDFQVQLLINVDRNTILRALSRYRLLVDKKDSLLIYYAGHGFYDHQTNKAYWLPVDAKADEDTNWIIADRITSNLKRMTAAHILIIADSCYSGALSRGIHLLQTDTSQRSRYLSKMNEKASRTLIASGGNEPVWDGGGGGNSVFARTFLTALTHMPDGVFTAEELFYRNIKERVAGNAEQTPEYKILRNSGHSGGDFIFNRKTGSKEE